MSSIATAIAANAASGSRRRAGRPDGTGRDNAMQRLNAEPSAKRTKPIFRSKRQVARACVISSRTPSSTKKRASDISPPSANAAARALGIDLLPLARSATSASIRFQFSCPISSIESSKRLEGAVKRNANGAFAHAQTRRHIGCAPSLQGNFLHDPTLALGQTRQQPSGVYRCGGVHIDRCLQGVGIVVDVDMVAESTPTQVISQLVAGNRAKPRFERLRLVPGVTLQMHSQQSLLNNILTIGRTSPRRCQAPSDDVPQPKRNMAEKASIRLVVALPRQSHHCGEIVQASQRGLFHIFVCAGENITRHLCRQSARRSDQGQQKAHLASRKCRSPSA